MTDAWFISDRSGFRFKYKERIVESTGFVVGPGESDGIFNLKDHPQNKSPDFRAQPVLKDARPDTVMASVGTSTDATWTPSMTITINP